MPHVMEAKILNPCPAACRIERPFHVPVPFACLGSGNTNPGDQLGQHLPDCLVHR
jgi:hypothetical protein